MKNYGTFLFDLDGTLVDSSPSIYASLRNMERMLGLAPLPEDALARFVGPPLGESFRLYYHADPAQVAWMLDVYRKDYKEVTSPLTTVYPGVAELLAWIVDHGGRAGVATLKNPDAARVTLELSGLNPYLSCVEALADGSGTTKGQLIERCMARLGNPPREQVVFFGDSRYDGVGALEAGVDFVALAYGFGFSEPGSMEGLRPVLVARQPLELLDFVKSCLPQGA